MAALVQSPEADARHTETEHITRDTAYTLPDGEFLLGLWKVEYGLLDSVTVGTYHFPWFIKLYNGHVKWRVWQGERWAFGTELGLLHLDFGNLIGALEASDSSASLLIVPWEGLASWRMNESWTFSGGFFANLIRVSGDTSDGELNGAAATSNLQLTGTAEWRWSDVTALVLHGRWLVKQTASASSDLTVQVDDYTTVEVVGTANTDALDFRAASLTGSFVWSWDTFNLRAGLGYGHWSFPLVGFVSPAPMPILDFDMHWVF